MFVKQHTDHDRLRLQLVADAADPDAVIVLVEQAPVPEAIPVIPTRKAESFWSHPSRD